jgi:transposase
MGVHLVFLDESGFLLIPNVVRTWAPKGQTPRFYHSYRHDRISAIGAVAVSPKRKHLALYLRFHAHNLTGLDIRSFFRFLLRHLRGPVVLLWDRGPIHRRKEVKRFLGEHPRVHPEFFPAYAPELNPAEYIWTTADRDLSNSASEDLAELYNGLRRSARRLGTSQRLLWSCIYASDLPWAR